MEKKPISRQGFDNLLKELKDLKENQRPEILKVVQWARSLGDLSENADYSAAKEKQRQIDNRIRVIEGIIENANRVVSNCVTRGWSTTALYDFADILSYDEKEIERSLGLPYAFQLYWN